MDAQDCEITDDDYPAVPYDDESFHADAGDIILADDVETNAKLRKQLTTALFWYEHMISKGEDKIVEFDRAVNIGQMATDIGMMIIKNAINNGYTSARLGK